MPENLIVRSRVFIKHWRSEKYPPATIWNLIVRSRVFIKHRRSENPPATIWNFPAKFHWPVEA